MVYEYDYKHEKNKGERTTDVWQNVVRNASNDRA